jgi:hypothetical protein
MKESYREGVASHPDPQPCEGGREAALEAWERGIRRQDIELRNPLISGADAVRAGGGQYEGGRQRGRRGEWCQGAGCPFETLSFDKHTN